MTGISRAGEKPEARNPSVLSDPRGMILRLLGIALGAGGRFWMRHGALIGGVAIAGFVAMVMAIGWLRPVHAWDQIAYLASAWRDAFADPAALHAHVWDSVRQAVPPEQYLALAEGDAYRLRQSSDPAAFHSMLGMYAVKWLYVKLLALTIPVFGAMTAAYVINIAAASLFAAVLIWWMAQVRMLNLAPLAIALLMVAGFPALAMAEAADMLNVALVTAAILFLDRRRTAAGLAMLALAVASRPDSVVFAAGLMGAFWLWRQRDALAAALAFALSFALYVYISKVSGHPGWWPHLWFSTYRIQDTMADFHPAFSLMVYGVAFAWNLVRSAFENTWLGLYVAALMVWALTHANGLKLADRRFALIGAALGAVALKFIIFPLHDGRTYFPMLVPALLLMMAGIRDAARARAAARGALQGPAA